MVLFTGIGSAIYWGRIGRKKLKVYVLSDVFDSLKIGEDKPFRIVSELVLFITFGILIGVGATAPTTILQALTAGVAWTGLFSKRVE